LPSRGKGKEDAIGLIVLEIEVGNPAHPIKPLAEEEFRLANGTKVVRKKGIALFRYGERVGGADVIFGEEGDHKLLGAFTLEALGLVLDPLKRELKPLPMLLATLRSR
jgi:hypothetical protein